MSDSRSVFHFTSIKLTQLAVLTVLLLISFQSDASDNAFYVGAAYGRVIVDRNVEDFDDGSISSGRVDHMDSGWKLNIGYRYNKHLAVEFGRTDLNNDLDSTTTFTGQSDGSGNKYAAGKVTVDIDEPIAYYLAAVGRLPMPLGPAPYDDRLALIGKIGVTSWSATETTIDSNGRTERDKDGTDIIAGLAVEYKWLNGIAIRTGVEYYRDIVGEQYEFHSLELSFDL